MLDISTMQVYINTVIQEQFLLFSFLSHYFLLLRLVVPFMYAHVQKEGGQDSISDIFFLMCDPLCFLRQGLSLIWNSSVRLGSLAIKAQKHSHFCLPSSRTASMPSCLPFSHVFLESNSGPHAFAKSALLTGPSLQSYICNNDQATT